MNYKKISLTDAKRIELHDEIGLTGAEISVNKMSKGEMVPFVHAHKENEEIYYVISGSLTAIIDNEEVILKEGEFLKIDPIGERCLKANLTDVSYLCIQVKANSLTSYTKDDAIIKKEL